MIQIAIWAATVTFTGLILHVDTDLQLPTDPTIAYLVDATTAPNPHFPRLVIATNDHTVSSQWAAGVLDDRQFCGYWQFPNSNCYEIDGLQLVISAQGAPPVSVTQLFRDHVLHLEKHLKQSDDLCPALPQKQLCAGAIASVEYTSGTLSVGSCHEIDAVVLNGVDTCLAREVTLELDPRYSWVIDAGGGRTIQLNANAQVRVMNENKMYGHHLLYQKLMWHGVAPEPLVHTHKKCDTQGCTVIGPITPGLGSGPTVDCSNSQWP